MIAKTYIQNNLTQINNLYKKSKSVKSALYYSKLALLELCGWIEESMDEIIRRCANRYLKEPNNLKFVDESVIQRTWGFEYQHHFRNMLIQTIGIIGIERLEQNLDSTKLHLMMSTLDTLKTSRNSEAHTHLKGITKRLDSPSVTSNYFQKVYDGLKDIENCIRKMKL